MTAIIKTGTPEATDTKEGIRTIGTPQILEETVGGTTEEEDQEETTGEAMVEAEETRRIWNVSDVENTDTSNGSVDPVTIGQTTKRRWNSHQRRHRIRGRKETKE